MARSPKSSLLIALVIAWSAAVVCALILTYGPHGPPRHPKMLVICLVPMAAISLVGLRSLGGSRNVIVTHCVLWVIACMTAFLMVNTTVGEGLHPIVTSVVLLVLGGVALGVLSGAKIEGAAVQETPEE